MIDNFCKFCTQHHCSDGLPTQIIKPSEQRCINEQKSELLGSASHARRKDRTLIDCCNHSHITDHHSHQQQITHESSNCLLCRCLNCYSQCCEYNQCSMDTNVFQIQMHNNYKQKNNMNYVGYTPTIYSQSSAKQRSALLLRCRCTLTLSGSNKNLNNTQNSKDINLSKRLTSLTSARAYTQIVLLCTLFVLSAFSSINDAAASEIIPERNLSPGIETGVCQSKDIRNSASQLNQLDGCRVIEGFLIISLIDHYNETDYDKMVFPNLTEITDYFILYRVNGLKSLLKMFPNLRVIRGNNLLQDYAFIVYEMMHLHEIGLKSLTHIGRGGVRIEKNPMLCFVDTIDWTVIASNTGNKDHILSANKPANECPICPSGKKTENDNAEGGEELECPSLPMDKVKRLCWNRSNCQKICPQSCGNRACNEAGICCDESCLGTCSGQKLDKCAVCRYFSIGDYDNRQCLQNCPADTYELHGRRCIKASECYSISRPIILSGDLSTPKKPMIPFAGKCQATCPADYYAEGESGKRYCKACDGICQKDCGSATIDSISAAQQYRGCTRVTGSVLIQIRSQGGHNVVKELETALSDIEEIGGSLKIVRSFPIVSLGFFKKLRLIRGNTLETERYALYVMDNQNLQSLFQQNVTIEKGKLFFHFNPKLCYSNIEKLKEHTKDLRNVAKLAIEDVATNSNGDKVACNVTILNATVVNAASVAAIIDVAAMHYEDERVLLGYVLHYIVAPFQNVSLYDGRDACGGDGWKIEDVTNFNRASPIVNVFMSRLKPYTQYAYYIKTYTIASEPYGGQTEIQYFRTKPDKPEPVRKLQATSNGNYEITIMWEPPRKANGNLTNYIIKATMAYDDAQLLNQRNYCDERMTTGPPDGKSTPGVAPQPESIIPKEPPVCDCDLPDDGNSKSRIPDAEAEQIIDFENELQNLIYVKKVPIPDESRRRRRNIEFTGNETLGIGETGTIENIPDGDEVIFPTSQKTPDNDKMNAEEQKSRKIGEYYEYIYSSVNSSTTTYVMRELKHYSSYTISVKACREGPGDNCSTEVIVSQRTAKIDHADDIKYVTVEKLANSNNSLGAVKITWPVPEKPNGIIVSYTIRYKRVNVENAIGQDICITDRLYQNLSGEYHLKQLENGNYSFNVMATSLAGMGNWSPLVYFLIDESRMSTGAIVGIIFAVLVVVSAIITAVWVFLRRKYGTPVSDLKLIASVNPEYVSMQYQPDEWEVPRDKILQIRELGQGSFGMVYEGIVKNLNKNNEEIRCAIKTVNENATDRERINFLKEAAVMKAFDTHHVVRLLGVVSCGQPTLVIMELMANGDLKGYLRSHRPEAESTSQPPSLKRILQMAIEIADGMAYLAAKKFVHRDLAARNCMVAGDLTVKIGDFGMTRDIYETDYYRKGTKGLLPVRWMAPESLKDGVFSSSSDVFSFGVVLWEMATLASQPYQGLSNDQVLRYVIDGGVMERPENCPDKLYRMMCRTWQHRPSSRPSFLQIVSMLLDDAATSFRNVSFYHSQEGQELLQQPQHQSLTIDVTTPLKAEEDDFSLEGLDDSYLMDLNKSNAEEDDGATHSPLR